MRPVIGICTSVEHARWGVWDTGAVLLPSDYVDTVQGAGGVVLLLPPDPVLVEDPDEVLDLLDALILAGGGDIHPSMYGAEPHRETRGSVLERDRFEIALARRALERDLPLLGICRGMQLMNVARGGTLIQHLPESHGHENHRRSPGSFDDADHEVRLLEGSLVARAAGEHDHTSKSHHHQGVDRLGDGLRVTGWSRLDDLPEAIEDPSCSWALGVQWHPEVDETSTIIASLVAEAAARRAARADAQAPAGPGWTR